MSVRLSHDFIITDLNAQSQCIDTELLNIQMPPARRVTLILTVTLNIQMPPVRAVTLLNSFADVVILVK